MAVPDREADENNHNRVIARRVIFRRNALEVPLTKIIKIGEGTTCTPYLPTDTSRSKASMGAHRKDARVRYGSAARCPESNRMKQTRTLLDRKATLAALRLLAWIGKRV